MGAILSFRCAGFRQRAQVRFLVIASLVPQVAHQHKRMSALKLLRPAHQTARPKPLSERVD